MARPTDLRYSETHEWVRGAKGEVVVGLTDYALQQLSDIVHIELPKAGDAVEAGRAFGEIESVKTVSDLVSPLTGKITAVNRDLADNLDALQKSPYEEGWLIKVKATDSKEIESLLTAADYDRFIEASGGQGH